MKIYTGVLHIQINRKIDYKSITVDKIYIHTCKDEPTLVSLIWTELFDYFHMFFGENKKEYFRNKFRTLKGLISYINSFNETIKRHDTKFLAAMFYPHEIKFHFKTVELEESDKDNPESS